MNDSATVELTASRYRALGDPSRLRILEALRGGPMCVCDLRDRTGLAGPLMSHHLNVLRSAGLITATRRGRWIDYALSGTACRDLAAAIPRPAGGEEP